MRTTITWKIIKKNDPRTFPPRKLQMHEETRRILVIRSTYMTALQIESESAATVRDDCMGTKQFNERQQYMAWARHPKLKMQSLKGRE